MKYYPDAHYKMAADITIGQLKTPLFDNLRRFNGVFDGDGHSINGPHIDTKKNYSSLFGFIGQSGVVRNVAVRNAFINIPNLPTASGPQ